MLESAEERYKRLHNLRKKAKVVNYSSLYGVGASKLSRNMGVSKAEAQELLDAFWKLNWAVREVAEKQVIKEVRGCKWVRNPVSGFWYQLRFEKDVWSTINQGTGVYVFDSWLARCAKLGYMGQMQMHDETGASVTNHSQTREIMKQAIEWTNRDLNCNVSFSIDTKEGVSYAEVH